MGQACSLIKRTLILWWGELILLTFFNVVWFLLQLLIITGPPATAAMYVIARRVVDGEFIIPGDMWSALRQVFWPAWKWGLINLVLIAIVIINFWGYWGIAGQSWAIMRLLWMVIALGWFALNLFYWPFWLIQSDRRMVNTYRNVLVLLLKMPIFSLTLAVISAFLIMGSVVLSLPLVAVLMVWLTLIGVLTVDQALNE
jgi:hypothetical protein